MDIFDSLIKDSLSIIDKYDKKIVESSETWPIEKSNIYLLDKDTSFELGGYPKDSINLLMQSSSDFIDGIYLIGDEKSLLKKEHISFGKIVIVKTNDETNDNVYDLSQKILLKDSKCYFKDVMTRASSKHYFINYKISNSAFKKDFTISKIAKSIHDEFLSIDTIEKCAVIIIIGDSEIYKELLPIAEKNKEITVALNHMFDGLNMDCGHCDMSDICTDVKGLREIHKKMNGKLSN